MGISEKRKQIWKLATAWGILLGVGGFAASCLGMPRLLTVLGGTMMGYFATRAYYTLFDRYGN